MHDPVLSGTIGGLLAMVLCHYLSRWVPQVCHGKRDYILVQENRWAIRTANTLFFFGFIAGLLLYEKDVFLQNDWRGLGLGPGGGCLAALMTLAGFGILGRTSIKEVYVAYAISQKTPIILIYVILVSGVSGFMTAAATLL